MNLQLCNPPLRTVKLYGDLGRRFGREHRLAVASPAEAIAALRVLFAGFTGYLMTAKDRGVEFAIFLGKRNLDVEELRWESERDDIRIIPVVAGASGVVKAIVGVVLVVVGVFTGNGMLVQLGVGLLLSGIAQMLAPHPHNKPGTSSTTNPNYAMDGPINTQAQGNPVPVLLGGPLIVGSAVISAGINVNNDAIIPTTGAAGGGIGGAGGSVGSMGGGGGGSRTYAL